MTDENTDQEFERLLAEERLIFRATELIAEAMEHRGITRKQLAEAVGVSQGEISQRLSGRRNLTLRSLAQMLHALHADIDVRAEFKSEGTDRQPALEKLAAVIILPVGPIEDPKSERISIDSGRWVGVERHSGVALAGGVRASG